MPRRPRPLDGQLLSVPVELLRPNPANPRKDLGPGEDLGELGLSLLRHGCLEPLLVEPATGGYLVVAGHRRLAAAKLVQLAELPCRLIPRAHAPADRTVTAAVENLQRRQMAPLEEAAALADLVAAMRSVAAVAKAVSRSQPWVRDRLALLDLPPDAQQLVAAGELKLTAAAAVARDVHRTGSGSADLRRPGRGRGRGRTGAYFGPAHRLADVAQRRCTEARHPRSPRVGTVACGPCWEAAIRDDRQEAP